MNPTEELPDDLVRVADQLRAVRAEPALESPDPALLDRIHATLGTELTDAPAATGSGPGAAGSAAPRDRRSLTRRSLLLGGVAGVALGAAGGALVANRVMNRATVLAKAALRALSEAAPQLGVAQLVRTRRGLELDIRTDDPIDFSEGFLEVWLLNSDGERMVSVGLFRPGDHGSYPIDQAVYDEGYVIVDISRQRYDEGLDHSGDSVMRGALKPE